MTLLRSCWFAFGIVLTCACSSSSATSGGSAGAGDTLAGGAGAASVGSGGSSAYAVEGTPWIEEGTAGTGLVSSVFGDPLSFGSAGVEPLECPHPSPGTCDWTRFESGCCAQYQCVNATTDPYDDYPITACQGLVDCLSANPTCPTAADPFCSARNGSETSACTVAYENNGFDATSTDEDRIYLEQFVRTVVTCVCGI